MQEIKKNQTLLEQHKIAQYNRNVSMYDNRKEDVKYWSGYIDALSLILEIEQ